MSTIFFGSLQLVQISSTSVSHISSIFYVTEPPPTTMKLLLLFLILLLQLSSLQPISPTQFIFNSFNSKNLSLFGNSTLQSNTLSLTVPLPFSIGRALYPSKIPTRPPKSTSLLSFFTSFIFSISPIKNTLPGHGLVFLFTPQVGILGTSSAQHLGLFNRTNNGDPNNHVFGIEFDVFKNPEFDDINDNHIGVNLNSLSSTASNPAGYWRDRDGLFEDLRLNSGVNYQVWIDYSNSILNVTLAPAGVKRPKTPLLSVPIDLSEVLLDEMYVGFCAATGRLVENHRLLAWSYSNSNPLVGDLLSTSNLPSFVPPKSSVVHSKGFIVGVVMGVVFVVSLGVAVFIILLKRNRKRKRLREEVEEWESEYWPHRMNYQDVYAATNGFSEENVIGFGGNGKVYKGVVEGGEVAVKRYLQESEDALREFLAEVSSLGRLKHRNLVGLRGWCRREKGSLILVYEYMENGSLDKRVYGCEEHLMLGWEDRLKVLKDVAHGVLYLHEGWEATVLHRDIKASNVLLDVDMNGRLGDFGLARMHGHGNVSSTTRVVGTVGYMAPEVVRSGKASTQTDVFGFGILVLEVVCGRMPIEEGKPHLVDWVWGLMERGELVLALDKRLKGKGGFDIKEVERVLHIGLLCTYPDAKSRPTMRQVAKLLEGKPNPDDSVEWEGMQVYLLDKMKSTAMWSKYRHGKHPTFEELRESLSSSTSAPWSDVELVEGR